MLLTYELKVGATTLDRKPLIISQVDGLACREIPSRRKAWQHKATKSSYLAVHLASYVHRITETSIESMENELRL